MEECYRGRNVRVFPLDCTGTLARLRERADALLRGHSEVLEIRLFGSLARGEAHPGSDADLFIRVRDGAPPFFDRIPVFARYFSGVGIGCDVLVYTESEAAALEASNSRFADEVFRRGAVLISRLETAGRE